MTTDPKEPAHYRERRSARMPVRSDTEMRHQDCYTVEVRIQDVSQCGFMAECDDSVQIGSYVALDVPGIGAVRAQVRWQIGGRMGGMFLDPISLSRCEWTAVKADAPVTA
jgi:hypothetical protein